MRGIAVPHSPAGGAVRGRVVRKRRGWRPLAPAGLRPAPLAAL